MCWCSYVNDTVVKLWTNLIGEWDLGLQGRGDRELGDRSCGDLDRGDLGVRAVIVIIMLLGHGLYIYELVSM